MAKGRAFLLLEFQNIWVVAYPTSDLIHERNALESEIEAGKYKKSQRKIFFL